LASNPRVLLLDEPLAGVGHGRIAETLRLIEGASHGRTVLMVEHNIEAVMNFAEEILVLEAGALLARGTPDQIRSDSKVRRAYLGD
jgi:branched-chain amino acid transport system ATP-binding protein